MVDKFLPRGDNVYCKDVLHSAWWISYPPLWWMDILLIHQAIELGKTYAQQLWTIFCLQLFLMRIL